MKGDEKVIEYLNKALRSELTAVSQYWLHFRLQEDWGYGRNAAKSRADGSACDHTNESTNRGKQIPFVLVCFRFFSHHASPEIASGAVTVILVLRFSEPVQGFEHWGQLPSG